MDRVSIHPLFYVGFDQTDPDQKSLAENLARLFCKYWKQGKRHDLFGKDVPYHRPPNSPVTDNGLWHVHFYPIAPNVRKREEWANPNARRRTSDRHLVYAKAESGEALLLAYIHDDAHDKAEDDYDFLRGLGEAAQNWFYEHNLYPLVTNY